MDKLDECLKMRQQIRVWQVALINVLHHRQARGRWGLGLAYAQGVGHTMRGVEGWVLQHVGSPVEEGRAQRRWRLVGVAAAAVAGGGSRWWQAM